MPSNKPRVTVYTDEKTYAKLGALAEQDGRSISNYTEMLIRKNIMKYELEHGEIKINDWQCDTNPICW